MQGSYSQKLFDKSTKVKNKNVDSVLRKVFVPCKFFAIDNHQQSAIHFEGEELQETSFRNKT